MPQGNVINVSDLIAVDDAGLHVDMRPVEAALRQSAYTPLARDACVFRRNGDFWQLVYAGVEKSVRHMKGMLFIHRLLEIAPESIPILQLRRVADPDFLPKILGSAGEVLDEQALRQIHERLGDIDAEMDEAKEHQDFAKQSDMVEEQESLKEQLRAGLGLGGRKRKAGDDLERNRKAVSNAIADAIKNITKVHPKLGRHLKAYISCGDHCFYRLEPGIVWST